MEPKKYEYIDSLRGIAILLVILVHIGYNLDNTMSYFSLGLINTISYCQCGVQLFFLVSAYTLTLSYYSRIKEEHQTRNFFIRRYFRIAPMFYLAILVNIILREGFHNISILKLLSTLTFTNTLLGDPYHDGYVPGGWTISVEFLFYLFLPFLCAKIKNLNSSLLFVLISLIITASYQPFMNRIGLGDVLRFSHFGIFYQIPVFALGILAYWLINDKTKSVKASTFLIFSAVALIFCYGSFPLQFIFSLAFFFILLALYIKPYRLLTNSVLAKLGLYSYSMYIIHFIVIHIMNETRFCDLITVTDLKISIINFIFLYVSVTLLSFIVASATYRFIEVPGQSLGRKLIKVLSAG